MSVECYIALSENYIPISLLAYLYKLFTRVITNRPAGKLDLYQPREQSGFRADFTTNNHLQVIKNLIEKSIEYNICRLEKAFDSIDQYKMLQKLTELRTDYHYRKLIVWNAWKDQYRIPTWD